MTALPASEVFSDSYLCAQTSAIICCYSKERWSDLCDAINSLRKQSRALREIIVVVDYNEELEEQVRSRFPDIIVIPNSGERGLSDARNCGSLRASGSYLLFLDDDATLEDGQLLPLLRNFQDPLVVGVSPTIKPKWTSRPPDWFPSEYLWAIGCTHTGVVAGPVRNLIGACMVLSREALLTVGGFASSLGRTTSVLPMGGEETEVCLRISKAIPGSRFVYEDRACAGHTAHAHRLSLKYVALRCFAEGLSKARIVSLVGRDAGLATERSYVLRVLTRNSMVRLSRFATRFDTASLAQCCVIWAGLLVTVAGYVTGRLQIFLGFPKRATVHSPTNRSAVPQPADTLET